MFRSPPPTHAGCPTQLPDAADPMFLTTVGRNIYFSASDADHGRELWTTDGTPEGTRMVTDLWPGPTGSQPHDLQSDGSFLWFIANRGPAGTRDDIEVFRTDGTEAGTISVRSALDVDVGRDRPQFFTISAESAFWATIQGLWRSNGTEANTIMLGDINTFGGMTDCEDSACFAANYRQFPQPFQDGIWTSNGIAAGTTFTWPVDSSTHHLNTLISAGNNLFFFHDYQQDLYCLNRTTGQAAKVLARIPPRRDIGVWNLTAFGNNLAFSFDDGVNGRELWMSDGTVTGTKMVRDIAEGSASSSPDFLTTVGDALYFVATEPATVTELWKTDGTHDGTVRVNDLNSGPSDSSPAFVVSAPFEEGVLFTAFTPDRGRELWWSQGDVDAAIALHEIVDGPSDADPRELTTTGLTLIFSALDRGSVRRLWSLDLASPHYIHHLAACLSGPAVRGGMQKATDCLGAFDADADNDIDLLDASKFINRITD